jgi:hypothetical protein
VKDGLKFQSILTAPKHFISPEKAVEIHRMIELILSWLLMMYSWPADGFRSRKINETYPPVARQMPESF